MAVPVTQTAVAPRRAGGQDGQHVDKKIDRKASAEGEFAQYSR